jgi:CheY-like chemotaxis protein
MLLRVVGEDVAIEFRPGTPSGSIKADPGQIEQVLMNLIVNARDAMPTGGTIIIETGLAELDEHYVSQHPGSQVGEQVVLTVNDTGCGMDESTRSKIFEPFFTTKAVGKGTGLGLSTVYGIVKQSGGYVAVDSELGKGTTFKIFFPRVSARAEDFVFPYDQPEAPRGSQTILVVEDNKALRELAMRLLGDAGYRVIEARNAEDALGILEVHKLEIDLLFTDVIMPGKTGVQLLAQAKLINPNLRVLFMSGYPGDLFDLHGELIPESSFLEKPFNRRSLLGKVYSVLQSEPARSN